MAASAVIVLGMLALLEWPPGDRVSGPAPPIELELSREKPPPVPELPADPAEPLPEELPVVEEAPVDPAPPQAAAGERSIPPPAAAEQSQIDWQASLESASAKTVQEHAETVSLHPEFDELRRIAATKYAEPRTGKPPPIWENVEDDIYGRTILRSGNCYGVLDDRNVGNRYAFETFEQHLVFCEWTRAPPQEFPWIEAIVARYAYLREPDGGAAGPAGELAAGASRAR